MISENEIRIRTMEEKDLAQLFKWNTPEMYGAFEGYRLRSKRELEKEYEKNGFFSQTKKILIVEEEYAPSGFAELDFYREGLVKIKLVLCEKSRGKGLGTKVTALITGFLFEHYPVRRIEAETDPANAAAETVLEKCGFEKEGVLRSYRFYHGAYHDVSIYGKIRETDLKPESAAYK